MIESCEGVLPDAITMWNTRTKNKGFNMDFSEALHSLKNGKRIARVVWNGKDMFLFLVPGSTFQVNRAPLLGIYPEGTTIDYHSHIDMKTAQGYIVPWLASQSDLLAEDWMELNDAGNVSKADSAG
jgi:hypothetical protein